MDRRRRSLPRRLSGRPSNFNHAANPAISENRGATFDRWLDYRLREMYSTVIDEPLPDELRQLVEKLGGEGDAGIEQDGKKGGNK